METTLYEWLSFGLRWLHVITGIAWIGSSFYFIALDLSLKKRDHLPDGWLAKRGRSMAAGFTICANTRLRRSNYRPS